MELSALRIKITKGANGFVYPNFDTLQCVIDSGMKWTRYVDVNGIGGHQYDQTSDFDDNDIHSPLNEIRSLIIVPNAFATQAVSSYSAQCTKLTETELTDWYDNRMHKLDPDQIVHTDILASIKAKDDLSIDRTATDTLALDPTNNTPGVINNYKKTWTLLKAKKSLTINEE